MKSIISDSKDCYICGRASNHTHHCIYGSNHKLADKYGLTVRLCHKCHTELHMNPNRGSDSFLKVTAQNCFENTYPDLDFMEIFGRNYRS